MIGMEELWWRLGRDAALGVAGLVLVSWGLDRWSRSAIWRRSVWQACFLGLALMILLEFTGLRFAFSMAVSEVWRTANQSESPVPVAPGVSLAIQSQPVDDSVLPLHDRSLHAASVESPSDSIAHDQELPNPVSALPALGNRPAQVNQDPVSPGSWLLAIWLGGAGLMALRMAASLLWTTWLARHARSEAKSNIRWTIEQLAPLLNTKPPSRILTCGRLSSPLHFGLVRPAILLPENFEQQFSPGQQRAMLAHELAHLAGRDLWWIALSEVLLVLLWWHPLVWVAHRQLQRRTETVADEACLILPGGPAALAECLVHFGSRMAAQPGLRWPALGAQGFRSDLGQRVERLVRLSSGATPQSPRKHPFGGRLAVTLVLLAGLVMAQAWPVPAQSSKGNVMILIQQSWKQSAAATLAAAALGVSQLDLPPATLAAGEPPEAKPEMAVEKAKSAPANTTPLSRYEMQDALSEIIIDNITLTSVPLPEALKYLNLEVRQKSRQRMPFNFIISRNPPGAADPATVSPPTDRPDPNRAVIDFLPLRKVNLADLLDIMVLSADQPLSWRLEDFGIVFSPPGKKKSDETPAYAGMSPELLKRYGIIPPASSRGAPGEGGAMAPAMARRYGLAASQGGERTDQETARNRVRRYLANTILDTTIEANAAALVNFLRLLGDECQRQHPDGPALNFVLSRSTASQEPVPDSVLTNATITIQPALNKVRLQDLILMIPMMSSIPLQTTIEPYGVVFTPTTTQQSQPKTTSERLQKIVEKPSRPLLPMVAKAFRLEANFLAGLQQTFGISIPDTSLTADSDKKIKSALASLAERLGIQPLDPDKQIFFNISGPRLMLRAPVSDIAVLEAAILTLGGTPLGSQTNRDLVDLDIK